MTSPPPPTRPRRLRLVDSTSPRWFCGHCAAVHAGPDPVPRVCDQCKLGVLLRTRADGVPDRGNPFLVVDSSLSVQALSASAEYLLGIREEQAVNRHVTEVLIQAEVGPSRASLAVAIARAAAGAEGQSEVVVRPSSTFGVRLLARVAACGPPPAALLILG